MAKETMLYFSLDANERGMYPAKNFLGLDMTDADTMQVSFKEEDGSADAVIVSLTIAAGKAKEAAYYYKEVFGEVEIVSENPISIINTLLFFVIITFPPCSSPCIIPCLFNFLNTSSIFFFSFFDKLFFFR